MKVGIILLCRYSSSRLPGKILREIHGKPLLAYILERLAIAAGDAPVVVATSVDPSDDGIADYCDRHGVACFRGDLVNVAKRFLDCATAHGLDYAVRINGDNVFTEMNLIAETIAAAKTGEYDYLTNTKDKTFPAGMNVEAVRTEFFRKAYSGYSSNDDFEHVTLHLLQHPELGHYRYRFNTEVPAAKGLQLAVDEQRDFDLASKILAAMDRPHTEHNLREIYGLYTKVTAASR